MDEMKINPRMLNKQNANKKISNNEFVIFLKLFPE